MCLILHHSRICPGFPGPIHTCHGRETSLSVDSRIPELLLLRALEDFRVSSVIGNNQYWSLNILRFVSPAVPPGQLILISREELKEK